MGTTWRKALARGALVAVGFVTTCAVFAAIWGGIFGFHPAATIYGGVAAPGWEGAKALAFYCVIFIGPPAAFLGFVGGVVWALAKSG